MPSIELTTREIKVLNVYLNAAIKTIDSETDRPLDRDMQLITEKFLLRRIKEKLKGAPRGKLRRRGPKQLLRR